MLNEQIGPSHFLMQKLGYTGDARPWGQAVSDFDHDGGDVAGDGDGGVMEQTTSIPRRRKSTIGTPSASDVMRGGQQGPVGNPLRSVGGGHGEEEGTYENPWQAAGPQYCETGNCPDPDWNQTERDDWGD